MENNLYEKTNEKISSIDYGLNNREIEYINNKTKFDIRGKLDIRKDDGEYYLKVKDESWESSFRGWEASKKCVEWLAADNLLWDCFTLKFGDLNKLITFIIKVNGITEDNAANFDTKFLTKNDLIRIYDKHYSEFHHRPRTRPIESGILDILSNKQEFQSVVLNLVNTELTGGRLPYMARKFYMNYIIENIEEFYRIKNKNLIDDFIINCLPYTNNIVIDFTKKGIISKKVVDVIKSNIDKMFSIADMGHHGTKISEYIPDLYDIMSKLNLLSNLGPYNTIKSYMISKEDSRFIDNFLNNTKEEETIKILLFMTLDFLAVKVPNGYESYNSQKITTPIPIASSMILNKFPKMKFFEEDSILRILQSKSSSMPSFFEFLVENRKIDYDIFVEQAIDIGYSPNLNLYLDCLVEYGEGDLSIDDNRLLFSMAEIGDLDGYEIVMEHPSIYGYNIVEDFEDSLKVLTRNLSTSRSKTYMAPDAIEDLEKDLKRVFWIYFNKYAK